MPIEPPYYWQIANEKYIDTSKRHNYLVNTLKTTVSNLKRICQTNEYNILQIELGYLFEHIKPSLINIISSFVEPLTRDLLKQHDYLNLKWNQKLFDALINLDVPDVIYWIFFKVPYYKHYKLDEQRKVMMEMFDYMRIHWDKKKYFNQTTFMFMTKTTYPLYPVAYQNLSNKELLMKASATIRTIFPEINYTNPNLANIKWSSSKPIRVCFISESLATDSSVLRDRMGIILNLPSSQFDVYYATVRDMSSNKLIKTPIASVFYKKMSNRNGQNKYIHLEGNLTKIRETLLTYNFHIIVYPDIGMKVDQTFLAYSRIAPIQINTWGHSDTSGISTIDYYITSKYFEVEEEVDSHYSEKPILLNSFGTYYYSPVEMFIKDKSKIKTRIDYEQFSEDDHIYWCMQTFFKFNEGFETVLANILNSDPKAQLLMSGIIPMCRSHMCRIASKLEGDSMKRIHMFPPLNKADFYSTLNISDVVLDPYPFGGCNSSLEAFDLGVPVVSMASKFINGRFTYGFYKRMGITECLVNNYNDYTQLALKLANNKDYRNMISKRILEEKHVLFEDASSVKDWANCLLELASKHFT